LGFSSSSLFPPVKTERLGCYDLPVEALGLSLLGNGCAKSPRIDFLEAELRSNLDFLSFWASEVADIKPSNLANIK
jgi:hypothetical protein